MRSSEVSGAGAFGFRAGEGRANGKRKLRQKRRSAQNSVALTAFAAAALFIGYDAHHAWQSAPVADPIGALVSAELNSQPAIANASMMASSGPTVSAFTPGDGNSWESEMADVTGRGAIALALAGFVTLLTGRRRKEESPAAEDRRENYESLATAIPMGLACWTEEGELIVSNDHYRRRLSEQESGLRYHDAVRDLIAGGYMELVSDDATCRLLELHRPDGVCLLVDERPLDDGGFMTLVSDISDRKRTEAALESVRREQRLLARKYHEEKIKAEAASKAKTSFLAHLSHDIRTPLNHIIGFADLMQMQISGPLGDERYVEYSKTIKQSGEKLLASFATILELAELEGGQKILRQEPVLLDEVMEGVAKRFRPQATRAGIHLIMGPPSGAVLRGDRLGLSRMIGNIMDNAVRFTRNGGEIILTAHTADDGVVIEICDTGIGMGPERLATLSQPFAMGDATFTRAEGGPGLGISIARAIAELSGGHLVIDSSPSLGTTVAISLPLQPAEQMVAA